MRKHEGQLIFLIDIFEQPCLPCSLRVIPPTLLPHVLSLLQILRQPVNQGLVSVHAREEIEKSVESCHKKIPEKLSKI